MSEYLRLSVLILVKNAQSVIANQITKNKFCSVMFVSRLIYKHCTLLCQFKILATYERLCFMS